MAIAIAWQMRKYAMFTEKINGKENNKMSFGRPVGNSSRVLTGEEVTYLL
jgi:hypothetical protein